MQFSHNLLLCVLIYKLIYFIYAIMCVKITLAEHTKYEFYVCTISYDIGTCDTDLYKFLINFLMEFFYFENFSCCYFYIAGGCVLKFFVFF